MQQANKSHQEYSQAIAQEMNGLQKLLWKQTIDIADYENALILAAWIEINGNRCWACLSVTPLNGQNCSSVFYDEKVPGTERCAKETIRVQLAACPASHAFPARCHLICLLDESWACESESSISMETEGRGTWGFWCFNGGFILLGYISSLMKKNRFKFDIFA